ncbi:MAG: hypothetical protein ACI7YS_03700 [Flavobacterium sp.]
MKNIETRHLIIYFNKLIYILMCVVALVIYALQKSNIALPSLINNYINDFLCLPIVLGGILFVIRWLKKDDKYRFSFAFIIFMASYYSFYFEYYLPKNNVRYTAEWIDVLLYFSGSLIFFYYEKYDIQKKPQLYCGLLS